MAIGTKLADFTTGSWANFESDNFQLVSLNAARFDTVKHLATPIVSDAKIGLQQLSEVLGDWKAPDNWYQKAIKERAEWEAHVQKQSGPLTKKNLLSHAVERLSNADPSACRPAAGLVMKSFKYKPIKSTQLRRGF